MPLLVVHSEVSGFNTLSRIGDLMQNNVTGLLARGLVSIGKRGGQAKWSWIFIIEGLLVTASFYPLARSPELTYLDDCDWLCSLLSAPKQRRVGLVSQRG